MAFTLALVGCESALHAWYTGEVQLVLLPFPVTSFVSGLTSLRVRTTTQTQKVQYREGRAASQACYLLPTNLPEQYQVSHQCVVIAHLERTTHVSKYRFVPCIPMCPPQNSKCNVTWPSNVINAAPHLPTTKNVKMKIHAPKKKHSKEVGDTCNSSASKKAQVYGPTLLSQAGATGIDVTWRKTFSQGA